MSVTGPGLGGEAGRGDRIGFPRRPCPRQTPVPGKQRPDLGVGSVRVPGKAVCVRSLLGLAREGTQPWRAPTALSGRSRELSPV